MSRLVIPCHLVHTSDERRYNFWHKRVLACHESVNMRMKKFRVLTTIFKHGNGPYERIVLHKKCFFACINLTQMMIQVEPLMAPMPF